VRNALRIAGRGEVEAAIAERGDVEVTCEFCNRNYTFAPDEARNVFSLPDSSSRDAPAPTRH
jgi:molecular chaperone Hsp33